MRGREGTLDGQPTLKSSLAEELLLLENIDILVLTETHSMDFSVSRKSTLLGHTGISSTRAGVAIISSARSGWYCTNSHILVEGYALLLHLHHRRSAESLWILGIYGDTSTAGRSLRSFYSSVADALAAIVLDVPDWRGCFAAGDWNFVLHPEDRIPAPVRHLVPFHSDFDFILDICSASDATGPNPFPKGWSYRYSINNSHCYSRLDCIYYPSSSWSASTPTSVPTLWSDHCIVWADCTAISPKVQMAIPASRLPDPVKLDDIFWSDVLVAYSALASTPISLPSWTTFKKRVLSLGSQSKARRKHHNTKNWKAALRGDQLSHDDLTSALKDMFSDLPTTSPSPRCRWLPAAPSYASRPLRPYPSFIPTPESPWATTTIVPWKYRQCPPSPPSRIPLIPRPSTVESAAQIHQVLTSRIKSRRAAALKKAHLMTTKHTSEWYNLSSNKEADEQGSRASISMVGLWPSPNLPATPVLAEMVHIARSFFQSLHTPEPFPEARASAQATLLDEVQDEYSRVPAPSNIVSGPFTIDEIPALFDSMPNTAPGPDGIPYSFWKSLHQRIQAHNKEHPQSSLVPFWDSFLDLANDVKINGSSHCGFKNANISLFFKKGDPTLTANYRPISSMNTDCKLYTNLINNRLSPWAVCKLHDNQKGFVPGRFITEHTCLAAMISLFFLYFSFIPLRSAAPATLRSITDPRSTDFPVFRRSPSCIALLGSTMLTDVTS